MARKAPPGLPTRKQILDFIEHSDQPAGKREIARAFGLKGADKIALKALLKDMADEGLIDSAPGRAFHKMGGVPKVSVLRIIEIDGNQPIAVPERWEAEAVPLPKLRVIEQGRRGALGIGDRILARTEERGNGYVAHPMKKLARTSEQIMGVVEKTDNDRYWLRSIDKRERRDTAIVDIGNAVEGQLVLAEKSGRPPRIGAKVIEVLGDPFAPKSFSLIAISKFGIPNVFTPETEEEALAVSALPISVDAREDLRDLPIIAIDPRDARDFDDAIWAAADEDPANAGGFRAIVAIADVSYYVRSGSKLDREARKRGNSVYFPDRVVPMLPHELSSDKCSLRANEDRAVLACHMVIDKGGQLKSWRFTRAIARIAANIPYEDAQAAIDGRLDHPMTDTALRPVWACWRLLEKARAGRAPLELELPERQVVLDDLGRIAEIRTRERLDAHRVVEDFMISANVAAAKALESKKSPLLYRVHEPPKREKLVALKEYLKSHNLEFTLGQIVQPAMFNRIIERVEDEFVMPQIMEQILRTQTQAYYTPANSGHFGLALGSYAHFTSPIRRYSDLIVHRALVNAFDLEQPAPRIEGIPARSGLSPAEMDGLERTAEAISQTERRAMEAERETIDRYVAAYLANHVGELVDTRITGVQNFGFFATVEGLGGDGLVPVSTLGPDYFVYDDANHRLVGQNSGDVYHHGQRLKLRLAEANPISGALRFELPDVPKTPESPRGSRDKRGRPFKPQRGRPANIRHQGRKR